jgi:hypothetical protein
MPTTVSDRPTSVDDVHSPSQDTDALSRAAALMPTLDGVLSNGTALPEMEDDESEDVVTPYLWKLSLIAGLGGLLL